MSWENHLSLADIGLDFLCSRCLINLDARTSIRAIRRNADGTMEFEHATGQSPRWLRLWAGNRVAEGCEIEVDDTRWRFEPVGTWHGDPVCGIHLWECRDRELRGARP